MEDSNKRIPWEYYAGCKYCSNQRVNDDDDDTIK